MQPTAMRPRSRAALLGGLLSGVLLIVVLALAACGAGAAPAGVSSGPGDGDPAAPSAGADGSSGIGAPFANLADRQIVKTGEVTLRVPAVSAAVGQVRAMALALGGYVGASQAGTEEDAATLTLRIPADQFDEALRRLHELEGEVLAEATSEEDVTSSIVDLDARITNLEASEAQYRGLVERAQRVADILSIQTRLDDVRGQIEQLKAQLEQLSGLATLATLTVTIVPPDEPVQRATADWDPGATVDNAVAALLGLGQGIGTAAIWLVIVGLPILALAAIVGVLALRGAPALRRRVSGPPR